MDDACLRLLEQHLHHCSNMWPRKRKLNEEKSKHAGLAQEIGFSPAFLQRMLRLRKGGVAMPSTLMLIG